MAIARSANSRFTYSTPNANRTLPARPAGAPYPEFVNNMPPTTTGPPPPNDAPFALTPFTVVNSLFASNVQTICPSVDEYARSAPSTDPENTTPGMTVIAADCAPLQFGAGPLHTGAGAGVTHARWPLTRFTAWSPPGLSRRKSETAK